MGEQKNTSGRVETVRKLKVWGYDGKQIDVLEKGSVGKIVGYVFEWDTKRDVIFDDHRSYSIPSRWLKKEVKATKEAT